MIMEIHLKRLFLKAAHTVLICSKQQNINFKRQVKINDKKFDEDFMFQLSKEEYKEILRCKNFTSS